MESSNSTVDNFYSTDLSHLRQDWWFMSLFVFFVIVSFVISIVAVIGNAIVIDTMMKKKVLRKCSMFSYIVSIAINDIVQGVAPAAMALEALRIFFSWVSQILLRPLIRTILLE